MRMRRIGNVDLEISEIGFGCYALSGAYGPKDASQFKAAIQKAYELGITFFDTADAYGQGEAVLGNAVHGFRDQVIIATKVGVTPEGGRDLSATRIREACHTSLRTLGTDYIDLYQIHFDDPATLVDETVAALRRLQQDGLIRYYGVGHLPADRVCQYLQGGAVTLLTELSAVERTRYLETLPVVEEHHAGVLAFSVTGRGLLTGKIKAGHSFAEGDIRRLDPLFQGESLQSTLRIADLLHRIGEGYGRTTVQVAIAWVLAQPSVVSALTGPSSIAHLEENVGGAGDWLLINDLETINQFVAQEEAHRSEMQQETVRRTLLGPLPNDQEQALRSLVAAMESMIKYGLVEEARVVPIFSALWRERKGGLSMRAIHSCQRQLANLLPR